MKTRSVLFVVLVLFLILAVSAVAAIAGDDVEVPFKALFATYPELGTDPETGLGIVRIPGDGQATHLGNSAFYSDLWVDRTTDPWTQGSDNVTITAASGDQLFITCAGIGGPTASGTWFGGDYEITGGTGRFLGAQGSGAYGGEAVYYPASDSWIGAIWFEGTLQK